MSEAWGLGQIRPVTLRPAEVWVGKHGVTEREREARVSERKAFLLF